MGTKLNPGQFDCHAAAADDEPLFTLLARDRHAPILVALWAALRELDAECADKVAEARQCAAAMQAWATASGRKTLPLPAGSTVALGAALAERVRQIEVEGWTTEHDDGHTTGNLATAAGCYALVAGYPDASRVLFTGRNRDGEQRPWPNWPWNPKWWKPRSRRRDLVRAAAMILAEIERIDRREAYIAARTKSREAVDV